MPHTYSRVLLHVVFSTKNRLPSLKDGMKSRLFAYMGGTIRELGGQLIVINGTKDHVHLLLSVPTTACIADFMRILKTRSSKWAHQEFPSERMFGWQLGYGVFSVSESNAAQVKRYIAKQKEHHAKISFKAEFMTLLKKHNIQFTQEYLWT